MQRRRTRPSFRFLTHGLLLGLELAGAILTSWPAQAWALSNQGRVLDWNDQCSSNDGPGKHIDSLVELGYTSHVILRSVAASRIAVTSLRSVAMSSRSIALCHCSVRDAGSNARVLAGAAQCLIASGQRRYRFINGCHQICRNSGVRQESARSPAGRFEPQVSKGVHRPPLALPRLHAGRTWPYIPCTSCKNAEA